MFLPQGCSRAGDSCTNSPFPHSFIPLTLLPPSLPPSCPAPAMLSHALPWLAEQLSVAALRFALASRGCLIVFKKKRKNSPGSGCSVPFKAFSLVPRCVSVWERQERAGGDVWGEAAQRRRRGSRCSPRFTIRGFETGPARQREPGSHRCFPMKPLRALWPPAARKTRHEEESQRYAAHLCDGGRALFFLTQVKSFTRSGKVRKLMGGQCSRGPSSCQADRENLCVCECVSVRVVVLSGCFVRW